MNSDGAIESDLAMPHDRTKKGNAPSVFTERKHVKSRLLIERSKLSLSGSICLRFVSHELPDLAFLCPWEFWKCRMTVVNKNPWVLNPSSFFTTPPNLMAGVRVYMQVGELRGAKRK